MKTLLNTAANPQWQEETDVAIEESTGPRLLLWNDDFNTFDFVIESLIEICGHTPEQAEQCTMLIHYKGKCVVKTASEDILIPMNTELLNRGLSSEII